MEPQTTGTTSIHETDEVDPRDVDWYTPGSPDFEVEYAQESEDDWL